MPSGVFERTKETRIKMSNSHKNKSCSEETIRKMSESHIGLNTWLKGKPRSDETKKKISAGHIGKPRSEATKKKIGVGHIGKNHSEATKIKISNGHMGKILSIKTKQKMSDAHVGKMPSCFNGIPFGNIKRGYYDINGTEIFFRSKMEANYALYLNFLVKQKQIKEWAYEKDVFIFEKIKFGVRSYRPDFKVINNDDTFEYHETKGWMDARSKTKIKRMKKYYPDIKLIIIDNLAYQDIKKKIGKMLKFY